MSDSSSSVSKNGILKKEWLEILTAVIYLNDSRFSFFPPFSESLQPHIKKEIITEVKPIINRNINSVFPKDL